MNKLIYLFITGIILSLLSTNHASAEFEINKSEYEWYKGAIKSNDANNKGINGKGVKIYLIDVGLDVEHSEFQDLVSQGRLHYNENKSIKEDDDNYHGTSMASLIVGKTLGVAPEATLYFHKKVGDNKRQQINDVNDAIEDAIEKKVDIISMSFTYSLYLEEKEDTELVKSHNALKNTLKKAKDNGILVIASSGNISQGDCTKYNNDIGRLAGVNCEENESNQKEEQINNQDFDKDLTVTLGGKEADNDTIQYPGRFDDVLTVGAIQRTHYNDNEFTRSTDWNAMYGISEEPDWESSASGLDLDVVAPGTKIKMAVPNSFIEYIRNHPDDKKYEKSREIYEKIIDDNKDGDFLYFDKGGTSAATAITAGIAALYKQTNPSADAYDLEQLVVNNAKEDNILESDNFNKQYGEGLVQAPDGLLKTVNNRIVLNNDVSSVGKAFDGRTVDSEVSTFYNNSKTVLRFEQPISVQNLITIFKDSSEKKELEITLFDKDKNKLLEYTSHDSKTHKIEKTSNVYYVELKNTSGSNIDFSEFDLTGSYDKAFSEAKTYISSLTGFNVTHSISVARDWNEDTKHFNQFFLNYFDTGLHAWATYASLKKEIYKEDLTDTINGQIVKKENVTYSSDLFNNWLDDTIFRPDGYVDYEFDMPQSITHLYLQNNPDYFNNSLEITFYNSMGYPNTITLGDDELFDRYVQLSRTYEDVKKIRIKNSNSTQPITLKEAGFYTDNLNEKAYPIVNYHADITIPEGKLEIYDTVDDKEPEEIDIDSTYNTTTTRGYASDYGAGHFDFIEIILPNGQKKWLNQSTKAFSFFPEGGLLKDKTSFDTTADGTWMYGAFTDGNMWNDSELYADGYIKYNFHNSTSLSGFYIKTYDYIDDAPYILSLALFDESGNVLYDRPLSREDLLRRYVELPKTFEGVKVVKIHNSGNYTSHLSEFELFK